MAAMEAVQVERVQGIEKTCYLFLAWMEQLFFSYRDLLTSFPLLAHLQDGCQRSLPTLLQDEASG